MMSQQELDEATRHGYELGGQLQRALGMVEEHLICMDDSLLVGCQVAETVMWERCALRDGMEAKEREVGGLRSEVEALGASPRARVHLVP
jgi:hypothetical protein